MATTTTMTGNQKAEEKDTISDGILLNGPHAKMVWKENKTSIIQPKLYRNLVGEKLNLLGDNMCWGIVEITGVREIGLKWLANNFNSHRITEKERKEWWKNESNFYEYSFRLVERYELPLMVEIPDGGDFVIDNVKFPMDLLDNSDLNLMAQAFGSSGGKFHLAKRIIAMMPPHDRFIEPFAGGCAVLFRKPPINDEIINDKNPGVAHAYLFMKNATDEQLNAVKKLDWTASKNTFEKIKGSDPTDDVGKFHKFTYLLINSFGYKGAAAGYNCGPHDGSRATIANRTHAIRERLKNTQIFNKDYKEIIAKYDSPNALFYIDPPYPGTTASGDWKEQKISWTTDNLHELKSLLSHIKGKFILSLNNTKEHRDLFSGFNIVKAHTQRIMQTKTDDFRSEAELLITNFNAKNVEHSEMNGFSPMEPGKEFSDIETAVKHMFETGDNYGIEVNHAGMRAIIVKNDGGVEIYSGEGEIITNSFPTIVEEVSGLMVDSCKLDCRIVAYGERNQPLGCDGLSNMDDSRVKFHYSDVIELNGNDLMNTPWSERKAVQSRIGSTYHLKRVYTLVVNTPDHAKKAIRILNNMAGADGCTIKRIDGLYTHGANSDFWINCSHIINNVDLEVKDFPDAMQAGFSKVTDWKRFVLQWHFSGHEITSSERAKEGIPETFKYKMDGLHTDARFDVGTGSFAGFTLFSPTSTDRSVPDLVNRDLKNVRCAIKGTGPKHWLEREGIAEVGQPGSTSNAPGVFIIVGKGEYRTIEASDHKIKLELNCDKGKINLAPLKEAEKKGILITRTPDGDLKQLPRFISFHIAHIGDRWIVLLDGVEE